MDATINSDLIRQAIADLTNAIQENPIDYKAFYNRGVLKNHLGDFSSAIVDYSESLKLNPRNDYAYFNIGVSCRNLDKISDAIVAFDKAIQINPNFHKAFAERAKCKILKGDQVGADDDIKRSEQIKMNDVRNIDDLIKDFTR